MSLERKDAQRRVDEALGALENIFSIAKDAVSYYTGSQRKMKSAIKEFETKIESLFSPEDPPNLE